MRIHSRQRQRNYTLPRINLTPLIDTALTLLVIFMVTTPLIQNGIKVELPKGDVNEVDLAQQPQEWTVTVDAAGVCYMNNKPMAQHELLAQLRSAADSTGLDAVLVRGDSSVSFGTIIGLVEAIKNIGNIKYVAFATEKDNRAT